MGTQKAKVHMLPISGATNIVITDGKLQRANGTMPRYGNHKFQHLYFTTDEEIKEGDWEIFQAFGKPQIKKSFQGSNVPFHKKIVATTNPELWGITAHPRAFTSSGIKIPKIDTPFIEAYIKAYNEGKPIEEVLLEAKRGLIYDKDGQWYAWDKKSKTYRCSDEHGVYTLDYEDAVRKEPVRLKLKPNGSVIIHPVKERMYTRKELIDALYPLWYRVNGHNIDNLFEKWLNKNFPE